MISLILKVEKGGFLDEEINRFFLRSGVEKERRPLIYEIVAGVIRWKLYLEWLISKYVKKRVKRQIKILLMMTLYQIEFMRVPYQKVIDEAVSFSKSRWGREVGNFVNAVLRNHIRKRDREKPEDLSVRYSFPGWLIGRWKKRFGEELPLLLEHLNSPPKFGLRLNLKNARIEDIKQMLKTKGIDFVEGVYLKEALQVSKVSQLIDDPLLKTGIITIQDEASQLASLALGLDSGDRILDACSGYGTKTTQLFDTYGDAFTIFSCDISKAKLKKIPARVLKVACDIRKLPFRDGVFDGILLDAPCSSLGIVRKHPEIKWRLKEEDLERFGEIQLSLLKGVWGSLKRGGVLIYSVCSFEPEETVDVIERFREFEDFEVERALPYSEENFFLSIPHRTGLDGFFIAKLRKL